MREFKESITGSSKDDDDETRDEPTAIAAPRDEGAATDRASSDQRDDAVSQPRG
jgi:hypothetical protein